MPTSERPSGDFYPRQERRGEPPAYQRTARFSGEQEAGIAYEQAQSAISTGPPNDLSTYRLIVNQDWYVAILGQQPPAELHEPLESILALGEPADLPEEIMKKLAARRAAALRQGPWVERHHRPGQHL